LRVGYDRETSMGGSLMTKHLGARQLLVFLAVCASSAGFAGFSAAGLQIIGIDVGQGDCTLIISPTGKTVLVDAGYTGQGNATVIPYLQSRGIDALDYTVASHYHVDHIGGMDEVVNSLGVDSIRVAAYDRGWSYTTQAYTQYTTAVGAKRQTMTEYQVIDLGGGATLTCLGLNGMGVLAAPFDNERYDDNNLSIALLLDYGEFQMLLAGDLPGARSGSYYDIESVLAPRVGDVDVYKVNHHGSATSSQNTLLNATLPEASLIYVGDGNSYGHPKQVVIDRLVAAGSYIYQTERGTGGTIPTGHGEVADGNIVIDVEAGEYTINSEVYNLGTTGVAGIPESGFLEAYPNPFSHQVNVSFMLPGFARAAARIFDVRGRLVAAYPAAGGDGVGAFFWNGTSLDGSAAPPGVYFVRVAGGSRSVSGKIVKR
jgi:beta-lactamase superfamily II metal-dependent hydrolase